MTTQSQISEWFDRGLAQKAEYMLIFCDTFDWSDYPSYAYSKNEALSLKNKDGANMQKLMEVYNLKENKEKQLAEHRCLAL